MILKLHALSQLAGPDDDDYRGLVPKRMLYMHPEAAHALMLVEEDTGGLVHTDIFRSAVSSRDAYRSKVTSSGQHITQPVSYSGHGYGFCDDLDVPRTLKKLGTDYGGLTVIMAARGFFCHRRDGNPTASESWHFNYLGEDADALLELTTADHTTWARPVEALIQKYYGADLRPNDEQAAIMLSVAHATDVKDFQRKWDLVVDGILGPKTRRVLAYVTATLQIETDPPVVG